MGLGNLPTGMPAVVGFRHFPAPTQLQRRVRHGFAPCSWMLKLKANPNNGPGRVNYISRLASYYAAELLGGPAWVSVKIPAVALRLLPQRPREAGENPARPRHCDW